MNILWITNFPLPDVCEAVGIHPHKGGSWMYSLAELLNEDVSINLQILSFHKDFEFNGTVNGIKYTVFPISLLKKKTLLFEKYNHISNEFKPDLVHIHGTENIFGLYFMEACPYVKSVVSIQGLVGIYSRYYYGNIKFWDLIKNTSFIELWKKNTFYHLKKSFILRGDIEKMYFQRASMILGRTSWDYTHSLNFNCNVAYHKCNETLRNEFYTAKKWCSDNIVKQMIFVSQASYPIKGFHILLQAVALLKNEFPNIQIRVAGESFTRKPNFTDKMKITGYWYGKLIYSLIEKHELKVEFLGILNSQEMVNEYSRANCFISASSIENSPNSIGEAQIIGTPVISSFVGGVPDMVQHQQTGLLYRYEEPEMLANAIRTLFINEELAIKMSNTSIQVAENRHAKSVVKEQLLIAYNNIVIKN